MGVADLEGRLVEAGHRGLELGVEVRVPLPLERDFLDGLLRGSAGDRVQGGVDRGVLIRTAAVSLVGHRSLSRSVVN